ncbi:hypothetical protein BB560_003689, partial [Smittium megazygosporum]
KERIEKERLEKERLEKERIEKERLEKERLEKERLEKERLEKERLEKERLEKERIEKERLEKERLEKERLEKERLEKERLEKLEAEKLKNQEESIQAESSEKSQTNTGSDGEIQEKDSSDIHNSSVSEGDTGTPDVDSQMETHGSKLGLAKNSKKDESDTEVDALSTRMSGKLNVSGEEATGSESGIQDVKKTRAKLFGGRVSSEPKTGGTEDEHDKTTTVSTGSAENRDAAGKESADLKRSDTIELDNEVFSKLRVSSPMAVKKVDGDQNDLLHSFSFSNYNTNKDKNTDTSQASQKVQGFTPSIFNSSFSSSPFTNVSFSAFNKATSKGAETSAFGKNDQSMEPKDSMEEGSSLGKGVTEGAKPGNLQLGGTEDGEIWSQEKQASGTLDGGYTSYPEDDDSGSELDRGEYDSNEESDGFETTSSEESDDSFSIGDIDTDEDTSEFLDEGSGEDLDEDLGEDLDEGIDEDVGGEYDDTAESSEPSKEIEGKTQDIEAGFDKGVQDHKNDIDNNKSNFNFNIDGNNISSTKGSQSTLALLGKTAAVEEHAGISGDNTDGKSRVPKAESTFAGSGEVNKETASRPNTLKGKDEPAASAEQAEKNTVMDNNKANTVQSSQEVAGIQTRSDSEFYSEVNDSVKLSEGVDSQNQRGQPDMISGTKSRDETDDKCLGSNSPEVLSVLEESKVADIGTTNASRCSKVSFGAYNSFGLDQIKQYPDNSAGALETQVMYKDTTALVPSRLTAVDISDNDNPDSEALKADFGSDDNGEKIRVDEGTSAMINTGNSDWLGSDTHIKAVKQVMGGGDNILANASDLDSVKSIDYKPKDNEDEMGKAGSLVASSFHNLPESDSLQTQQEKEKLVGKKEEISDEHRNIFDSTSPHRTADVGANSDLCLHSNDGFCETADKMEEERSEPGSSFDTQQNGMRLLTDTNSDPVTGADEQAMVNTNESEEKVDAGQNDSLVNRGESAPPHGMSNTNAQSTVDHSATVTATGDVDNSGQTSCMSELDSSNSADIQDTAEQAEEGGGSSNTGSWIRGEFEVEDGEIGPYTLVDRRDTGESSEEVAELRDDSVPAGVEEPKVMESEMEKSRESAGDEEGQASEVEHFEILGKVNTQNTDLPGGSICGTEPESEHEHEYGSHKEDALGLEGLELRNLIHANTSDRQVDASASVSGARAETKTPITYNEAWFGNTDSERDEKQEHSEDENHDPQGYLFTGRYVDELESEDSFSMDYPVDINVKGSMVTLGEQLVPSPSFTEHNLEECGNENATGSVKQPSEPITINEYGTSTMMSEIDIKDTERQQTPEKMAARDSQLGSENGVNKSKSEIPDLVSKPSNYVAPLVFQQRYFSTSKMIAPGPQEPTSNKPKTHRPKDTSTSTGKVVFGQTGFSDVFSIQSSKQNDSAGSKDKKGTSETKESFVDSGFKMFSGKKATFLLVPSGERETSKHTGNKNGLQVDPEFGKTNVLDSAAKNTAVGGNTSEVDNDSNGLEYCGYRESSERLDMEEMGSGFDRYICVPMNIEEDEDV